MENTKLFNAEGKALSIADVCALHEQSNTLSKAL